MRLDTNSRTSGDTITKRRRRARGPADTLEKAPTTDATQSAIATVDLQDQAGLTRQQISLLEQRLREERARALRAIWAKRGDIEDHRETGLLDEVELDIRMAERHSEFISMIDDALKRLRTSPHDFDVSEVSGARIPFERLEMVPWTRRLTEEIEHV